MNDLPKTQPKYYTVTMKCANCCKTLGVRHHTPKVPGVQIDYVECLLHSLSKHGYILEWEPEDDGTVNSSPTGEVSKTGS